MIHRRQFFGAVAATTIAIPGVPLMAKASGLEVPLNWRCDVIKTIPHNRAQRQPVITGVSLQPKGDLLAIVGDDHCVSIYDHKEKQFREHLEEHSDWVRAARFSPDGDWLVTAGNDRTLKIWNVGSWERAYILKRHPNAIIQVSFSPSGKYLATVGFDSMMRVYDLENQLPATQLECVCPDNHAVAFSADGELLAAAGRCGNVRVWETRRWKQVTQFKAHRKRIRSLEFTNDGKIISASDDQMVHFTDPANPGTAQSLPRMSAKLFATAMMDNLMFATGGSDNKIKVWNAGNQNSIGELKGHTGTVSCLDYSDSKLVSGSFDTHVRLWYAEGNLDIQGLRHTRLDNGWIRKIQ